MRWMCPHRWKKKIESRFDIQYSCSYIFLDIRKVAKEHELPVLPQLEIHLRLARRHRNFILKYQLKSPVTWQFGLLLEQILRAFLFSLMVSWMADLSYRAFRHLNRLENISRTELLRRLDSWDVFSDTEATLIFFNELIFPWKDINFSVYNFFSK